MSKIVICADQIVEIDGEMVGILADRPFKIKLDGVELQVGSELDVPYVGPMEPVKLIRNYTKKIRLIEDISPIPTRMIIMKTYQIMGVGKVYNSFKYLSKSYSC